MFHNIFLIANVFISKRVLRQFNSTKEAKKLTVSYEASKKSKKLDSFFAEEKEQ